MNEQKLHGTDAPKRSLEQSPDGKMKGNKKYPNCCSMYCSDDLPQTSDENYPAGNYSAGNYPAEKYAEKKIAGSGGGREKFHNRDAYLNQYDEHKIPGLSQGLDYEHKPGQCESSLFKTYEILDDLNVIFKERLDSIDCLTDGNMELKFITYQEWVDTLLKVTENLFDSVKRLESQSGERIGTLERKLADCIEKDCGVKVESLKHDRDNLLEIIHRAVKENRWNIDGLNFITIDKRNIFGLCTDEIVGKEINSDSDAPNTPGRHVKQKKSLKELTELLLEKEIQIKKQETENENLKAQICELKKQTNQNEKISSNIKALAVEVADKYDEIREMKKQIFAFEEEILNAQKKIQLKDDVIKELRSDLKALVKFDCCKKDPSTSIEMSSSSGLGLSPSLMQTNQQCNLKEEQHTIESSNDCNACNSNAVVAFQFKNYDKLIEIESQRLKTLKTDEQEYMKILKDELSCLIECQDDYVENLDEHKRILNGQQEKITNLVQSLIDQLKQAEFKLDYLRENLLRSNFDNGTSITRCSPNFPSPNDLNVEVRIVKTIRNRIEVLEDENNNLRGQIQQLHMNMNDAKSMVDTKVEIIENNTCVLKNVASALSVVCGQEIPYQHSIPSSFLPQDPEPNQFCEAINVLGKTLQKKNNDLSRMRVEINELNDEIRSKTDELICSKTNFDEEINAKSQVIKSLRKENKDLKNDYKSLKEKETSSEFVKLLDSKNNLQSECNNQLMVIKSLREALEACRRENNVGNTSKVASSSSISNSNHHTNSGSSIWTWWKDNVHNV